MLPAKDDPEAEQHGVKDALTYVPEQKHPGPVEADREPLHRDVDEGHGDAQRQDHPEIETKKHVQCIVFVPGDVRV